jgi:hypothetical protein
MSALFSKYVPGLEKLGKKNQPNNIESIPEDPNAKEVVCYLMILILEISKIQSLIFSMIVILLWNHCLMLFKQL